MKLHVLREKHLLKLAARPWLPEAICYRPKRPYRAPIHRSFFNESTPDYVRETLSPHAVKAAGFFQASAVDQLVRKIKGGAALGETDDMALVGILSTQLLHDQFVRHFPSASMLPTDKHVKICRLKQSPSNYELQ